MIRYIPTGIGKIISCIKKEFSKLDFLRIAFACVQTDITESASGNEVAVTVKDAGSDTRELQFDTEVTQCGLRQLENKAVLTIGFTQQTVQRIAVQRQEIPDSISLGEGIIPFLFGKSNCILRNFNLIAAIHAGISCKSHNIVDTGVQPSVSADRGGVHLVAVINLRHGQRHGRNHVFRTGIVPVQIDINVLHGKIGKLDGHTTGLTEGERIKVIVSPCDILQSENTICGTANIDGSRIILRIVLYTLFSRPLHRRQGSNFIGCIVSNIRLFNGAGIIACFNKA